MQKTGKTKLSFFGLQTKEVEVQYLGKSLAEAQKLNKDVMVEKKMSICKRLKSRTKNRNDSWTSRRGRVKIMKKKPLGFTFKFRTLRKH
jgi:hypothetical protein